MLRSLSPKRSREANSGEEVSPQSTPTLNRKLSGSKRRRSFRKDKRQTLELAEDEDPAKFEREWGMSKQQEEELLQKFKASLKEEGVLKPSVDKYVLRRFLRARQHDLKRAREMFVADVKWRKEFGTDTILQDFHFHERDAFISVYPQGYHKTDKMGRPVYIQHLGAVNVKRIYELTTEERTLRFHVQEYERCARYIMPACSRVAGRHIETTFAIIDVKGVGLKHLTGDVKKMMSKVLAIDQNHYPEMLGHTVIINAPSVFKMLFGFIKPMLDSRTQAKIEVAGSNYLPQLLAWVDRENLPDYLGGTSTATLIDDAGPWQDPAIVAEIDAQRSQSGHIEEQPEAEAQEASATAEGEKQPPADRGGGPEKRKEGGAAVDLDSSAAFGEALPALRRQSSAATSVGEDGYYSPRSDGTEGQWDDASERANSLPDLSAVSPSHWQQAGSRPHSVTQIPINARVKALEAGIPQQQERLAEHLEGKAAALPGEQAPLLTRVEALERAMAALLKAQEAANTNSHEDKVDGAKTGCCGCTIM